MLDDKNTINNMDDFNRVIQKKLENHTVRVEEDVWAGIESALNRKKRRVIPFWYWISGGAAVAVIALLFMIHPFTSNDSYISKSPEIKSESKYQTKQKLTAVTSSVNNQLIKKTLSSKHIQSVTKTVNSILVTEFNTPDNVILKSDSSEITELQNESTNQRDEKQQLIAENNNSKNDTVLERVNRDTYPVWENDAVKDKTKKTSNQRSGILLAAAFSAGGSVSTANNGYEMAALGDKNIVTAATSFNSVLTPNDFSQIIYSTPVSFAVVVQKPIDEIWKIESGLVYTYLSTKFQNSGMQQNNADLHLHYIGVPLNLIAQISKNKKWEFYLSGGGMLEKGIRSIYIQNQTFGNQIYTTTAWTNIGGFQWSINAAMGTTYKLNSDIGIYIEPKIAYFFNNNQPVSARTDQPVSIGLTAGLRFQLK